MAGLDSDIQHMDRNQLKDEVVRLRSIIRVSEQALADERNKELNIALMRNQAKLSDAEDTLRRWRTELEIVASKEGHNGCHIWIPELLKNTLGHTGKFLDSEKMTPEEFANGCIAYHCDRFGECGVKLAIIKEEQG